ncbi:MAG: hypothetical protein AB1584_04700 [Pseudomonadota bacterium]
MPFSLAERHFFCGGAGLGRPCHSPAADVRDAACHLQQPRIAFGFAPAPHLFRHVLDRAENGKT